jgi:threonine/homoserine/homoserine lactone efflux protein
MVLSGFWAFVAMSVVMEITPGPNMGYLAIVSLTRGRRAGMAAVAGTASGLLLIGVLGALGAAAIVAELPPLYQLLRWGGVAFLFWLAWDGWRSAEMDIACAPEYAHDGKYALRGLVTNLLNPKAFLFYVSVLPNFIDPAAHVVSSGLILTVMYVAIATAVHTAIVLAASSMRRFLDEPDIVRRISRALSLLLGVIALWLLWETRG